jgi:hypothetical protein
MSLMRSNRMSSFGVLLSLSLLPALAGCWALNDLAAQRRYERSMAYATPVQANGVSAKTPLEHLLLTETSKGFILNDPDGFISFTVVHTDLATYQRVIAKGKLKAVESNAFKQTCRGTILDVQMVRFGTGPVTLVYRAYFEIQGQGISAEYTHSYFQQTSPGETMLSDVPTEFVNFLNSIEIETVPVHS